MRPVIAVFAKAPRPGMVKTRLAAVLGDAAAAELHRALVADLLERLRPVSAAGIELHTDIDTDAWREFAVTRKLQCGGDLGLRMLHALGEALARGAGLACILGSDAPVLPLGHLDALLRSTADVALGPAEDGGYYAIACRRLHPQMFAGVAWSSAEALRHTERAAKQCGLSVELGPAWWDVDRMEDLRRLARSPELGRRTQCWMAANSRLLE
jgi:rSAM/selenodomain-associated transferase 1